MRIQITQEALIVLRQPETPTGVRQAVAALTINPRPPDAAPVTDRPGRYEFFESGFWIVCQSATDNLEEIVIVTAIQPN